MGKTKEERERERDADIGHASQLERHCSVCFNVDILIMRYCILLFHFTTGRINLFTFELASPFSSPRIYFVYFTLT